MKTCPKHPPQLQVRRLLKGLHLFRASSSRLDRRRLLRLLLPRPPSLGPPDADPYLPSNLELASTRDRAVLMAKADNSPISRLACNPRPCLHIRGTSQIDTRGGQVNSSAEMAKQALDNYFLPPRQSLKATCLLHRVVEAMPTEDRKPYPHTI